MTSYRTLEPGMAALNYVVVRIEAGDPPLTCIVLTRPGTEGPYAFPGLQVPEALAAAKPLAQAYERPIAVELMPGVAWDNRWGSLVRTIRVVG